MQSWMRYLGPVILVVAGIILYFFVDADLPVADTQALGLVLILAGLVWGALEVLRQAGAPRGNVGESGEEHREDH